MRTKVIDEVLPPADSPGRGADPPGGGVTIAAAIRDRPVSGTAANTNTNAGIMLPGTATGAPVPKQEAAAAEIAMGNDRIMIRDYYNNTNATNITNTNNNNNTNTNTNDNNTNAASSSTPAGDTNTNNTSTSTATVAAAAAAAAAVASRERIEAAL